MPMEGTLFRLASDYKLEMGPSESNCVMIRSGNPTFLKPNSTRSSRWKFKITSWNRSISGEAARHAGGLLVSRRVPLAGFVRTFCVFGLVYACPRLADGDKLEVVSRISADRPCRLLLSVPAHAPFSSLSRHSWRILHAKRSPSLD